MRDMDFSCFDGVLSPVMAVTPDLQPLYANRVAVRMYPILTSRGLNAYFKQETLGMIRSLLSEGQAFSQIVSSDAGGIVFSPVLRPDGSVSHVLLFVESLSDLPSDKLSYTANELLCTMQAELAEPLCDLLRFLERILPRIPIEDRPPLQYLRKRLLCASALLFRNTEDGLGGSSLKICDADAVLCLCSEASSAVRYRSQGPCYIPMGRDSAIRLFVEVLAFTALQCSEKKKVTVSFSREEHENRFTFTFPSETPFLVGDDTVIGGALYSLVHRMSRFGGRCEVDGIGRKETVLRLVFPKISLDASSVTVGEPRRDVLSRESRVALAFLRTLIEEES